MLSTTTSRLNQCLKEAGIQPAHFAYFLQEYIEKNPDRKRMVIASLLSNTLREQAALIQYHLNEN